MTNGVANKLAVQIRWLIARDLPDVLRIENECFDIAWTRDDFMECLRTRNTIGMVAEYKYNIVGFMAYRLFKSQLTLLNFAVDPLVARQGVGTQMIKKLVDKLSHQRRNQLLCEVRETNLPACLFFRSQGFRCVSILKNHYDDTAEDAYVFRYRLGE